MNSNNNNNNNCFNYNKNCFKYNNNNNIQPEMSITPTFNIVSLYQNTRNSNNYYDTHHCRILAYNNNWLTQMDSANFPLDVIKQTIGKNGFNFKKKTEQNNLLSIWYDSNSNVIEFWGDNYNKRLNAMKSIQNNLNYNLNLYNQKLNNNKGNTFN